MYEYAMGLAHHHVRTHGFKPQDQLVSYPTEHRCTRDTVAPDLLNTWSIYDSDTCQNINS
jgi:hypothetical protein